jgi:hypothetical protein
MARKRLRTGNGQKNTQKYARYAVNRRADKAEFFAESGPKKGNAD